MPYFTFSGNKLVMTALAAGALAVGGTGVAAMADSHGDSPVAAVTESPSPTPTDTVSPEPTETETAEAEPTETETAEAEPTETKTAEAEPEATETGEPEESPAATPVGPDATGPAAVGLCNAFGNGGLNSTSTAYTALMQVAGGAEAIDDYCATVPAPQGADNEDAGTDGGDGIVQPQSFEPQSEGAAASGSGNGGNGSPGSSAGAGHQGNSAKHSHHG